MYTLTNHAQGFRMLVGDPYNRVESKTGLQNCYRCYTGPNFQGDDLAPCSDKKLDTPYFPKGPCLGGIRSNIEFPTSVVFFFLGYTVN
jgi:hypothetical protein